MPDRHEHFASRAAYRERVVRGRSASEALALLTAAYDFALFELDGVPDTAFVRQRARIARTDAEWSWDAVATLAAYVAEVEAALIPGQSPSRTPDGPFLPAYGSAPWSEWRSSSEAVRVPIVTVLPVRILQDETGRTVVEAA
ncbi:MAG: hypothetical protein V4813_13190 [Gemmatimonadota bacterium]